jgi:hypothetical protein
MDLPWLHDEFADGCVATDSFHSDDLRGYSYHFFPGVAGSLVDVPR